MAENVLAQLPFPSSLGTAAWIDSQRLEFRDVKIGDFFYADSVTITAVPYQLLRHHITELDIRGGQVFTGPLDEALKQGKGRGGGGLDWTITKLVIGRGTLMLQDLAPNMPAIPVRLGVVQPIILNYIKLNKPDASFNMTRERTLDIENVNIASPFDPLAPVLSLPLIRVRFTYDEMWHHSLREVDLVHPVLHLGEDLFWFSDEFKKEHATAPAQGVAAPWHLGHFQVRYGKLGINVFGQPKVQFPFFFDTDVDDIRLDQLDRISAKSVVAIRNLTTYYPDYKIKIVNLHGEIGFSIPPSDVHADNVVPTVQIDELAWNGIAATKAWSSVTFDPNGIYGKLGGKCEGGYVKGNFEVYYTKGFLWNADLFADRIDSGPIAEKLVGKYFSLTGTLDGRIAVSGKATEILSCKGQLDMLHPGKLEIHSLDRMMKKAPASLKDKAVNIALEACRLYPYEMGAVKLDYSPGGGTATLKLSGPMGQRDFSVYLHPYPDGPHDKVAKAEETR